MAKSTGFYDPKFFNKLCERIGFKGKARKTLREVFKKEDAGVTTPGEQLLIILVTNSPANKEKPTAKRKPAKKSA